MGVFDGRLSGDALITNNHGVKIRGLSFSLGKSEAVVKNSNILQQAYYEIADRNVNNRGSGFVIVGVKKEDGLSFYNIEFHSVITEFGDLVTNHCEVVVNDIRPISVELDDHGFWKITEPYSNYVEEKQSGGAYSNELNILMSKPKKGKRVKE